jgi:Cys-rich protein (TIGR01571 family)
MSYGQQPTQYQQNTYGDASSDPNLARAQKIMNEEFLGCLSDPLICLLSTFVPEIQFGLNAQQSGKGNCLVHCCCMPCCMANTRSHIQKLAGVPDAGFAMNCIVYCLLPWCSVAQEARAIKELSISGLNRPVM